MGEREEKREREDEEESVRRAEFFMVARAVYTQRRPCVSSMGLIMEREEKRLLAEVHRVIEELNF